MSEEEIREQEEHDVPEGFIDKERWEEMGRDPDEWRSPEEFKEKGEQINSVLKKQRDELKREIDDFRKDFDDFRTHQHQVTERKEREAYERAKAEYEEKLIQARVEKAKAIEAMDSEGFLKAEDKEKSLTPPQEPKKKDPPPSKQPLHPDIAEFINRPENSWYSEDKGLQEYADFLAVKYIEPVKSGQMTIGQALEKVSGQVKEQFPQKFSQRSVSTVESGGGTGKKGKSYRDLPADAKSACDRFVKRGIMTKEQYVKDYFGE